ncbi:MAG: hypothetical protein Q9185_003039 [Variospora sp. 1 TL-2023]
MTQSTLPLVEHSYCSGSSRSSPPLAHDLFDIDDSFNESSDALGLWSSDMGDLDLGDLGKDDFGLSSVGTCEDDWNVEPQSSVFQKPITDATELHTLDRVAARLEEIPESQAVTDQREKSPTLSLCRCSRKYNQIVSQLQTIEERQRPVKLDTLLTCANIVLATVDSLAQCSQAPPINRSTKPTQPNAAKQPVDLRSARSKSKGKAAPAVIGGDVRLTQCPRCKRFADKYVEHDYVVLFIDLVLVKPQVYRHLLFNRLGRNDDELDPSITRLGTLLLLFDVYLTWSRIETLQPQLTSTSPIPHLPILLQYAFYLLLCALTTAAQHLTIRWLAGISGLGARIDRANSESEEAADQALARSSPNGISTALFVSSCMNLFPILMVVWKYDDAGGSVGRGVDWAVAVQNLEALRILLECGYLGAAGLVGAGWMARWAVARLTLGSVGLGGCL